MKTLPREDLHPFELVIPAKTMSDRKTVAKGRYTRGSHGGNTTRSPSSKTLSPAPAVRVLWVLQLGTQT